MVVWPYPAVDREYEDVSSESILNLDLSAGEGGGKEKREERKINKE